MKKIMIVIVAVLLLFGCGQSYEETKRITKAQRLKMAREDSAALKVAVLDHGVLIFHKKKLLRFLRSILQAMMTADLQKQQPIF